MQSSRIFSSITLVRNKMTLLGLRGGIGKQTGLKRYNGIMYTVSSMCLSTGESQQLPKAERKKMGFLKRTWATIKQDPVVGITTYASIWVMFVSGFTAAFETGVFTVDALEPLNTLLESYGVAYRIDAVEGVNLLADGLGHLAGEEFT